MQKGFFLRRLHFAFRVGDRNYDEVSIKTIEGKGSLGGEFLRGESEFVPSAK